MKVSEARIAANRANALKSTGPKTPEGKERSRANALKHGLCSSVVVAEDFDLVKRRHDDWFFTLKPQNEHQAWLVRQVAVISVRIDRCERIERKVRDKFALRAELSWDDDRRLEAAALGGRIERDPEGVVEALRRTPQGCEWLMSRWAMLAHVAVVKDGWTPEQARLAFDLLGTPAEFRDGQRPGATIDLDGQVVDSADDPAAVARREVAALRERIEVVAGLDEVNRAMVEADLTDESGPELKRLRRYEGTLHSRLRWCLAQLRYQSPHARPSPHIRPLWDVLPEPECQPEAKPEPAAEEPAPPQGYWMAVPPHPPFDLTPDEFPAPGQDIDIPAILAARAAKKVERSEKHRQARRRKLEKLRA